MPVALSRDEAVVVGRIRDALDRLGYAVTPGRGPGTLYELARLAPHIAAFTKDMGSEFSRAVRALADPHAKARFIAEVAERRVASMSQTEVHLRRLAGAVKSGVETYKAVQGGLGAITGLLNQITALRR